MVGRFSNSASSVTALLFEYVLVHTRVLSTATAERSSDTYTSAYEHICARHMQRTSSSLQTQQLQQKPTVIVYRCS